MQFQSETNGLDLYSDCLYWCGIASTDTTSYPIKDFTRNANFAVDKVTSLIMRSDGRWKWDDSNNVDLPIATIPLVANQQDYPIAVTHLKIKKIRIKDSAGNWVSLTPVDRNELTDSQLTATAGDPKRYDKIGNSIFLYPAPSYSSVAGFEVQFQRAGNYFDYTDNTKEPGFASQFHRLISLYPASDYCSVNGLNTRLAIIANEITKLTLELVEYYSSRSDDKRTSMSLSKDDFGESALSDGK